jgi:hypothetical protein
MSAIHLISTQNVFWPNNIVHSLLTTSRHMDKTDVRKAWARQVLHLDRKQKPLAGAEPRWGRKQTLSRGLPDAALLAWVRPSTRTSPPSLQVYRRQGIRLVNSDTSLANLGRVMDDGRRLWTWLATWPESCSVGRVHTTWPVFAAVVVVVGLDRWIESGSRRQTDSSQIRLAILRKLWSMWQPTQASWHDTSCLAVPPLPNPIHYYPVRLGRWRQVGATNAWIKWGIFFMYNDIVLREGTPVNC